MSTDLVKTKNGILRGKSMTSRNGLEYKAFLGIRYGTIPSRFAVAVPSSEWDGIKDATEFGSACAQYSFGTTTQMGDEDCLFLNVYTPQADVKKRPVLVYIHGGGLTSGSGDTFGANYYMDEDIVLVTLNYRLGMLGFLNLEVGDAAGNMGAKDQVLALKWVQENIEAFGGDPCKVTVSGENAGGECVVHLVLSPLTKGLFRSAYAQSGSALVPSAFKESSLAAAFRAGRHLGCFTESATELLEFLKGRTVSELLEAQAAVAEWNGDPSGKFPLTVEILSEQNPEPFYPDLPRNIAQSGNFNRVPLILIVNKEEGSLLSAGSTVRDAKALKDLNVNWEQAAPNYLGLRSDPGLKGRDMEDIAKKIRQFYFKNQEITLSQEAELTDLNTDARFLHGIYETAVTLSKYTTVYIALGSHRRQDYSIVSLGIPELLGKVTTHMDDLQYLFNGAAMGPDISQPRDLEFSKGFVSLISSFVKTGIPEVTLGDSPKWGPVSKEESETAQLNFLKLDLQPEVLVNPFDERMRFWDSIYQNKA